MRKYEEPKLINVPTRILNQNFPQKSYFYLWFEKKEKERKFQFVKVDRERCVRVQMKREREVGVQTKRQNENIKDFEMKRRCIFNNLGLWQLVLFKLNCTFFIIFFCLFLQKFFFFPKSFLSFLKSQHNLLFTLKNLNSNLHIKHPRGIFKIWCQWYKKIIEKSC